jgi:hypothetical protein
MGVQKLQVSSGNRYCNQTFAQLVLCVVFFFNFLFFFLFLCICIYVCGSSLQFLGGSLCV